MPRPLLLAGDDVGARGIDRLKDPGTGHVQTIHVGMVFLPAIYGDFGDGLLLF